MEKDLKSGFFTEVTVTLNEIADALLNLDEWSQPEKVSGDPLVNAFDTLQVRREPLGVVLNIAPWN